MSTHSKIDLSTLGWVKTEIDETLKQARLALESFAENPSDKTRLRFCATHLHQVVGTLLMVELDGAAMLARETEALAEAVINDKAVPDSKVFDVLTRGILTLPDYLSRLQYGQLDVPLKHITLINELRAAHNAPPISELELFSPDLSVRPPPAAQPAESGPVTTVTPARPASLAAAVAASPASSSSTVTDPASSATIAAERMRGPGCGVAVIVPLGIPSESARARSIACTATATGTPVGSPPSTTGGCVARAACS